MKKFLVIPVMFLYLLAVSGVMIHMHYCGNNLESWSVYAKSNGCDEGECGDEKQQSDDCCNDKVVASKMSPDQHFVDAIKLKLSDTPFDLTPRFFSFLGNENSLFSPHTKIAYHAHAPSGLWQNIPLYKLHARFTYYG